MTDAYAETDVWPNPPATPTPAPDRTGSAPDASRVLGDAPTATVAREAAYAEAIMGGKERAALLTIRNPGEVANAYRDARAVVAVADAEQAELRAEVQRLERVWRVEHDVRIASGDKVVDLRAELTAAEARLRAVEALLDSGRFDNDVVVAFGQALFAGAGPAVSDHEGCDCTEWCSGESTCRPALASAAPAVSDGEGATSEAGVKEDRPASPVVAPSATEAPQAPAEQGFSVLSWVEEIGRQEAAERLFFVDKETGEPCPTMGNRLCTITDPDHRHKDGRPAPSPLPDTADDEGPEPEYVDCTCGMPSGHKGECR